MNKILFKLIEGKGKFFLNGDLKNGEIVNPEVLPILKAITAYAVVVNCKEIPLNDGDTFDLPEGMCIETFFPDGLMAGKSYIRLLPEKPVQKEESQEELWADFMRKWVMRTPLTELKKLFTIKRKES